MRTIILLGELGKRYGRRHRLDVKSAAEAVRALCANFKDFAAFVSSSSERGVGYRVLADRKPTFEADELQQPVSKTIHIVPVLSGAGGGIGKIFIGAALIVIGIYTGQAWLVKIGVAVTLGGVAQMLSPVPKAINPSDNSSEPSYVFNGAINTTSQGHPVPIGYGRMIVGSAVISAGISVEDVIA